jgi:hypothetical protein
MAEPKPDPTLLTTASLLREIANLKELQGANLEVVSSSLEGLTRRFDHKYVESAADLQHLRELVFERIEGMRELSKQAREDHKISLDAAFRSAKEAGDKSEQSFEKQIKALSERTESESKATNEKINLLQSRIDLGEGKSKGAGDLYGYLIGAAGVGAAIFMAFERVH